MPETELQGVEPALWREVIPFYAGDCDVELTAEGGRATREYLVPWELRQEFSQQMLGYPELNSQGRMRRHLPETLELLTDGEDFGYMTASRLRFRGLGGGGEVPGLTIDGDGSPHWNAALKEHSNLHSPRGQIYRSWEWAHFQVEFTTQLYDILSIDQIEAAQGVWVDPEKKPSFGYSCHEQYRYVVWNDESRTQMGTTEHGNWVFDGTDVPAGNKVGIPIPSGEVSLTWYDVHPNGYSANNLLNLQGRFNSLEFFGYPRGTLVFDSWKRKRRRSPFGSRTVNLEFRFVLRPWGANHFPDSTGQRTLIVNKNDRAHGPIRGGYMAGLFFPQSLATTVIHEP